jgi:branched-chain amino acid transport system substrate-binding protein
MPISSSLGRRAAYAAVAFALLLAGLSPARPAQAAVTGPPVEVNALIPLTGPGAFIGNATKKDFDLIQELVNKSGGIKGRPVKFVIGDDQANPQVSVQLLSDLIAKKVPIVFGGVLAGNCRAMAPLVAKSGPMQWCLSPGIHPVRGSYTFSVSVGTLDDAIGTVRFFREKGWTKVAIITTNDAIGQELDRSYAAALALPENKSMQVVADEHFNPSDISVAGQVAAIKSSGAQAVLSWVTGTPFGTLLRAFHDAGLDLPVSSSTGNMSFVQMAQYTSFLPSQLYFAGLRSIAREGTLAGPVKDAQNVYFNAFKAAGLRPDVLNAIGWDPIMIVMDAYRKIGPDATADQLRDFVDNLHGYAGTSGIYDFGDPEQRGLTISALVIDKWDPVKQDFVSASRPGGHVK